MTRYLSAVLGAQQPLFGQSIQELERASGRPSADIRLSSELMRQVRLKISDLDLDPQDTTGPELYGALQARLQRDERIVRDVLSLSDRSTSEEVLSGIQKYLKEHITGMSFSLKAAAAKRLLKKKIPKNTMKKLGYRSIESMLKHEPVAHIYAAALMIESSSWQKNFRDQYNSLQPSDFEQRHITVMYPKTSRWEKISEVYVQKQKHNIMCFKEIGAIVILPMASNIPGLAITTLLLVLHYMNDIRTYSSFAKLQQVKVTFGRIIADTAFAEPMTTAKLAGQPVPWKVIQKFYGKLHATYHPEVFEPHVQADDLQWRDGEEVLTELSPRLNFWKDTQHVFMLHEDEPISLNILDIALSYCNQLSFPDRIVHFAREHLWHELMSRYLHQGNLEAAVHEQLSRELVAEQNV